MEIFKEIFMKKLGRIFVVFAFTALIGFTISACDNGTTSSTPVNKNSFVGTWTGTTNAGIAVKMVFTDTTWTLTYSGSTYSGNYTRSESGDVADCKNNSGTLVGKAMVFEKSNFILINFFESYGIQMMNLDKDISNPEPIYEATGTWGFLISGYSATVKITGSNWVFTGPTGAGLDDSGTYTRTGNIATLYSIAHKANIGTATLLSNTSMTLKLVSPSFITGTFSGTKK